MCPARKTIPGTHDPRIPLDLGELINSDWDGHIIDGGRLFVPGYRGAGYTPGDLRAQFWFVQEINMARHDRDLLKAEVSTLHEQLERANERAEYYRQQLRLESRMGMMLSAFSTI